MPGRKMVGLHFASCPLLYRRETSHGQKETGYHAFGARVFGRLKKDSRRSGRTGEGIRKGAPARGRQRRCRINRRVEYDQLVTAAACFRSADEGIA